MTLTPEQIAERLARKCAAGLAMDSAHIPIIAKEIHRGAALVEFLNCVQQLRKYDTVTLMGEQLRNPELAALDLKLKQLLEE